MIKDVILKYLKKSIDNYTYVDGVIYTYHSGRKEVVKPEISYSRVNGERGRGFYMFYHQEPASKNKYTTNGYINVYKFNLNKLEKLYDYYVYENCYNVFILHGIRELPYYSTVKKEYYKLITFDTGASWYTREAGGQIVIHSQEVLDECVEFYYSAYQRELFEFYSRIGMQGEINVQNNC